MTNPVDFVHSLLSEKWESNRFTPRAFVTRDVIDGDVLPIVCITLRSVMPLRGGLTYSAGLNAKNKLKRYLVDAVLYTSHDGDRFAFEEEVERIVTVNNYHPTTNAFPDPLVKFIDTVNVSDIEHRSESVLVYRREVSLLVDVQKMYS